MYMFTPLETILVCNLKKNYHKTDLLKEFLTGQEAPFGGPAQIVKRVSNGAGSTLWRPGTDSRIPGKIYLPR